MSGRRHGLITLPRDGTAFYLKGDRAEDIYRVKEGVILLCLDEDDARRYVGCGLVLAGETFGEEAVLDPAGGRQHTALRLRKIHFGSTLVEKIKATPPVVEEVQRDAYKRMIFIQRLWATEKSEDRLEMVCSKYSTLYLTHEIIATLTNNRREMVTTLLNKRVAY